MNTNNNVPEIRFKGFGGEWEEKSLDSVYRKIRNAFVGTATPYYVKEGNFYLESNNVKDGKINRKTEIFINDEFYHKQSDKWLKEGDIVMVQSGHVGHTAVIPPELNNIAAHALIMFTEPKEEVSPHFLNIQFQTENIKTKLSEITTGNTIKHILSSEMKEFEMFFTDLEEQTAIGNTFQQLDSLINQHQQKHNKLCNIKQAMLQKMFPQQGQTMPQIRFKGFEGEWVERELGEVFTYERPDNYIVESSEYSDEYSTPVLTANKGFILGYTNEKSTYSNPSIIFDDFTLDCKFVDFPYMVKSSAIKILTVKNGNKDHLLFAFHLLNNARIEVMGHARHYISVVQNTKVNIPQKNEQTVIGNYFQTLDTLINQHQQQITKLNNIKQACLSKMFV